MTVENDVLPDGGVQEPPEGDPPTTGSVSTAAVPETVRNSPEYRELQRQNRELARRRGDAERREAEARAEAERLRTEREAQQDEAVRAEVQRVLGDEGVAAWEQFAELSATDPIAAAREMAKWRQANPASTDGQATTEGAVTQQQRQAPPPPPIRTLDGGSPLASVADDAEQRRMDQLDKTYEDVVARNRRREPVRRREREGGIMAFMESSYRKLRRERR